MKIATVISFCTNEYRFIHRCVEEAKKVSDQIVIVFCDHFFNGVPENQDKIQQTIASIEACDFIEFRYCPNRLYSPYHKITPEDREWSMFWAATQRYIGFYFLRSDIDYVLFLDADEILDGDMMKNWLATLEFKKYQAMRFGSYLYALKPNLRAKKYVNLPLFVQKETFMPLLLINELERIGAYLSHSGPKREEVLGINNRPFVHHYSWVRTKEECLLKSKTWGHRNDENWEELIEKAFRNELTNLFASGLEYALIDEIFFDPFKPNKIIDAVVKSSYRKISMDEFSKHVIAKDFFL